MRYSGDAPKGVIDYLLIECMLWGKAQGYQWFNLGMAPLSGLEEHALAPAWHKLGRMVQRYGEMFYHVRGPAKIQGKVPAGLASALSGGAGRTGHGRRAARCHFADFRRRRQGPAQVGQDRGGDAEYSGPSSLKLGLDPLRDLAHLRQELLDGGAQRNRRGGIANGDGRQYSILGADRNGETGFLRHASRPIAPCRSLARESG